MQTYLIFTFDLGYGDGLPVILPISDQEKVSLLALKNQEFSDDDYISFDENYVTINSVLESMCFTTLPVNIDYDFSYAKNIVNMILDYTKHPITFANLTMSNVNNIVRPPHSTTLSPNEQAVNILKNEYCNNHQLQDNQQADKSEQDLF